MGFNKTVRASVAIFEQIPSHTITLPSTNKPIYVHYFTTVCSSKPYSLHYKSVSVSISEVIPLQIGCNRHLNGKTVTEISLIAFLLLSKV